MMKRMTKFVALLMCTVMLGAMVTGCGESESAPKQIVQEESVADASVVEETQEEAAEETEEAKEEAPKSDVTIEEQVLLDEAGVVITAKEYVKDSIWGDGIKVEIQNNSDQNILAGCNALIVNGYHIYDLFGSSVAAGKKANETIYLSTSELEAAGISTVGEIELDLHVSDDDTWESIIDSVRSTIKTSEYDNMEVVAMDDGTELYNEGGIRIVGKTVDENSFWGTALLFYIENNSGKDVDISAENLSINGYMLEPYFYATVYDGRKTITELTLMEEELTENEITSIEDVELTFNIIDNHSFDTIAQSDIIKFTAK